MKKLFRGMCLLTLILTGCASNKAGNSMTANEGKDAIQKQVETVRKKMITCIAQVNANDDAKDVNDNIIIIFPNNPNAKKLLSSSEFITDQQAVELKQFKEETMQCRSIAKELPKPEMVAVYEYYYSKVDDVYNDLVNKKITIGVANQERQMRLHYTNDKWADVMKNYQGS
jgi:hypothetical protein